MKTLGRRFARYIVLSTIPLVTAFVCACDVESTAFKADSYGISLRGGYRLDCGDGELSALRDSNLREIIPPGVVLSVFRSGYCIGYYDGGAFYERNGEQINLDRVFFIIDFLGKLSYYEADPDDCRFYGPRILEQVHFQKGQ